MDQLNPLIMVLERYWKADLGRLHLFRAGLDSLPIWALSPWESGVDPLEVLTCA